MTQYDLNLREYWWIFKKRKFVVIFFAILLGFFSTAFAILRAPEPIYVSVSKIKFEKETPVEGLFAETITWANGDDILTQTSMIKSYAVLQEVAQEMGLIPQKHEVVKGRLKNHIIGVIENLQSKVNVSREDLTNILHIEVTHKNPVYAQRLANTIARTYSNMYAEQQMKRTTEAIRYIGDRLREVNRKLRESEDAYSRFSQNNQLISMDLRSENLLARTLDIENAFREFREDEAEFQGILDRLENFIQDPSRSDMDFYSMKAGNQYRSANETLIELMIRRDTLLKSYTLKHPEVQAIDSQIIGNARKMTSLLQTQLKHIARRESDFNKELARIKGLIQVLMDKKLELDRLKRTVEMHKEMTKLLEQKNEEALIRRAKKPEEVTVIKPAMLPSEPINPPKTMTTGAIGVLIGLILGLVAAFVIETFDTSLGAIEDVEVTLGTQVLGVIPYVDVKDIREGLKEKLPDRVQGHAFAEAANLVSHLVPESMVAESFRSLETNIQFKDVEKKIKTIAVASTTLQEGKTMVAMNLAITMAKGGMKVLLVGCDLRKSMVAKRLGLERRPGLTEILLGSYAWRDSVKGLTDLIMGKMTMEEIMMTPGMDNLHIITSGAIPPNPADLVGSARLVQFIEDAKKAFDIVIFDSTPILSAADAAILGRKVDGVLLVYRVGKVSRRLLKRSTAQLEQLNCSIIGVVLNGMKPEVSPDFHDYIHCSYYHSCGSSDGEERVKGHLINFSFISKMIRGQGDSQKSVEIERDPISISPHEIPRKKPNRMKLSLIFVSWFFLAAGLLWQNGVVDPFEWIKPIKPISSSSTGRKSKPTISASSKTRRNSQNPVLKKPVEEKQTEKVVERKVPPVDGKPVSRPIKSATGSKAVTGSIPPVKETPAYPYSLYIGSFKTFKLADRAVSIYTRKGLRPAYKVKVLLSNGAWYRVYMGYFGSKEGAERFRLDNNLTETEVKETAYANLIGTYTSTATLKDKIQSLKKHGFSSYVITDTGGQYRLFVGAFHPKERAERTRKELESKGIHNTIVKR